MTAGGVQIDLAEVERSVNAAMYESGWCQRSTERRPTWRHTSEGGFNRKRYAVQQISYRDAVTFVEQHHYSGRRSSARKLRYGLIDLWQDRLVGVAVFGSPMRPEVLTNPLPDLNKHTAAELSRLVLLDEVESNGESHLVGRALRDCRQHGIKAVVAFSDAVPRPEIGMPGHVGDLYRAMQMDYCGRATAGPLLVLPDSTVLTRRAMQKVRKWEQGSGGVVARLVAAGAPTPEPGEEGKAYLRRAMPHVKHKRFKHPGTHRFVCRLGSERQRASVQLGDGFEPRAYPTTPDPIPTWR